MAILRRKSSSNFTTINNEYLHDIKLSWKAKGMITYLMSLPNDWNVNISDLSNRSLDGRDGTSATLNEIIKKGYGTKSKTRHKGKFDGYDYLISDVKINSELPLTEKPLTDKPLTENPTLLNTNSNKDSLNKNNRVKSKTDYTQEREILNSIAKLFDSKYYDTESKKVKWLEEIRKLITIDKEKPEDIIAVITFAKEDDFWNQNLLSITALRKKNQSGISKYDNIKAKMPDQVKQSHIEYKNGITAARDEDIRRTLGDEYTYQQNVVEGKCQYVEYQDGVYMVRTDNNGKYIIANGGRIEV